MMLSRLRNALRRKWSPFSHALGGALLVTAPAAWPQEEDWSPILAAEAMREYYRPDETISIELPELPQDVLKSLAVELDANDISSLVRLSEDGRRLVLDTEVPLEPGTHNLRLVELDADGNLIERGVWAFEVRQSPLFRSSKFSYTFGIDGSQRVHAREEPETPDELEANGSGRLEYLTDTGKRINRAQADLMYDSNWRETSAPRPIELGDFLLTSEGSNSRFSAGHHFPGPVAGTAGSSLIMDGGSRRGVSSTWGIRRWPTNFSAFMLRTDSIYGFQNGLGIGDSDNRIEGLMFDTLIYSSGESRMKLGIGHVRGAGEQGGTAIGDPANGNQLIDPGVAGDASNLTLEGVFAEGQFSTRLELAQTARDIGFGLPDVKDDAYTFLLGYQPKRALMFGNREMTWNASFDHQKIGGFFRSLASPGGAIDVEMTRLNAAAQLGGLSSALLITRAEDNVNDLDIPTTEVSSQGLNIGYAPEIESNKLPKWLQQPNLNIAANRDSRQTAERQPGVQRADRIDMDSTSSNLSLSFVHPFGSWGVSYSPSRIKDHTGAFGSSKSRAVSLDSSFQFGERYSLAPGLSWDRSTDETTDITTKTRSLVIGQQYALIPRVLDLGLSLSQNFNRLSDGSTDTRSRTADLNVNWQVQRLKGLSVWMRGSYNDSDERARLDRLFGPQAFFEVADNKDYQVFMGFNYQFQPGG